MSEVRTDRPLNPPTPEVRPRIDRPFTPEVRQDDRPRNPVTPEVRARDSVEEFIGRLTGLGASLDMVDQVRAHWDDPWDDEPMSKEQLVRLSDDDLRALIEDVNTEYRTGTLTEDEQSGQDFRAAVVGYQNDAENVVTSGTVDAVLEWVGDDLARAQAALTAEQTLPDHRERVTLVTALEEMLTEPDED
jgi:hypothetical protein